MNDATPQLSTMYLMGCSAMQSSWVWCRHGISLAQDVGAHKKGAYGSIPNAEDEQFKRAFWSALLALREVADTDTIVGSLCSWIEISVSQWDVHMPRKTTSGCARTIVTSCC